MGNHRFRISDMMPNVWFFKLKDMGKPRNHTKKQPQLTSTPQQPKPKQTHLSHPRKSYYISRDLTPTDRFYNSTTNPKNFPETPRKSSKQRPSRKSTRSSGPKLVNVTSSVSAGCSCRASIDSVRKNSESPPEFSSFSPTDSSPEPELCETPPPEFRSDQALDEMVSCSSYCKCRLEDNKHFANKFDKVDGFHTIPGLELPPIITKSEKFNVLDMDFKRKETVNHRRNSNPSLSVKVVKEEKITVKEQKNSSVRRFVVSSPGVRLRLNSPRITGRKIQAAGRKSVSSSSSSSSRRSISESFAIMKSSFDPQRDFRDSMVEMIVENNIRASKDLEELLACYLSLNSDEYHDLIIKVFKQIWFDLTDINLKH